MHPPLWPQLLTIASVLVTSAQGQIVREMTPERIREAIELGSRATEIAPYKIQERARWSWPPLIAVYTTPFLRVALAARTATQRHQRFTEADVTPEMAEPAIHVYGRSQPLEDTAVANVETVMLLPYNSKDTSQTVRPTRMSEASQQYKDRFGFGAAERAVLAVFPLDVWREDSEVHVIFDKQIPSRLGPRFRGGCTDCKSRIYLEKIREGPATPGRGSGGVTASPGRLELGLAGGPVWPDRNAGRFESRAPAEAAFAWAGYRFLPNLALEINLGGLLEREYPTPAAIRDPGNPGWAALFLVQQVDEQMPLRTVGAEIGLRAFPTLGPLEPFVGMGVGIYTSKLTVTGTTSGVLTLGLPVPGELRAEEEWGPGLRLSLGADLIVGRILDGSARLGVEYRYLNLRADFGELSGGEVAIGGPQAALRLVVLY